MVGVRHRMVAGSQGDKFSLQYLGPTHSGLIPTQLNYKVEAFYSRPPKPLTLPGNPCRQIDLEVYTCILRCPSYPLLFTSCISK